MKHKYRLDFCVIDPVTMQKTGFELSPGSTHGELTWKKAKDTEADQRRGERHFDKEVKKHKLYYKTDIDLADPDNVFAEIEDCLNPKAVNTQLNFHLLSSFFKL